MNRLPIHFADLSPALCGLSPHLMLWALIFCLLGAVNVFISVRLRRYLCVLLSLLPPLYGFAALLILERLKLSGTPDAGAPVFLILHIVSGGLTVFSALLLCHVRKTKISPASIAESFDRLSPGVCFYLEGGRCVLVNEKMRAISFLLTGHTVRSGEELAASLPPGGTVALPDGTVRSVTLRTLTWENAPLYELTAADVTELSLKTARLKSETARLARMNDALRAYSANIGEHVRQNEILRAKMNIHDEMNRLLLQTQIATERADPEEMRKVAALWQSSALLLKREAEEDGAADAEKDLGVLAASLGISLVYESRSLRRDGLFLRLFTYAAREAMLNAVKHARAGRLFIACADRADDTLTVFRNDGLPPEGDPAPHGGLKNLKNRLKAAGGSLEIRADGFWALTVIIPKGEP